MQVLASGWGVWKNSHVNDQGRIDGPVPDILQEITLTTLRGCAGTTIDKTEFCAGILTSTGNGFEGLKDTCSGDSGGPAALNRDNDLNYELVGAVSRGRINALCEAAGQATVYADVYGNQFLEKILKAEKSKPGKIGMLH